MTNLFPDCALAAAPAMRAWQLPEALNIPLELGKSRKSSQLSIEIRSTEPCDIVSL